MTIRKRVCSRRNGGGAGRIRAGILILLMLFLSPGMSRGQPVEESGGETGHSVLDTLLVKAHRPRPRTDLSRFLDTHTLVTCRTPLILDFLSNPFYMPALVQVYGAYFKGSRGAVSPTGVYRKALELASVELKDLPPPRQRQRSLMAVFEDMEVRFRRGPMSPGTRASLEKQIEALPEGMADVMSILCEAFMAAAELRRDAIKHLTTGERHTIIDNPLSFFQLTDDPGHLPFPEKPDESRWDIIRIARKIDIRKLFLAENILAEAVEITRPKLQWIHKRTLAVKNDEILLDFQSPLGPIIVGGPGINRYDRDAALLVDLDGSDIYNNNAGGCFPVRGGVACLIDMGGNDMYIDERIGVQGAGILGVGILVDYHGDDAYIGGDWSQGAGYFGVGILYDEKGSDNHRAGILSQGAGAFGAGLNIDVDGHDNFACDGLSQGFGSTMGLGILVNVYGRDNYAAGKADSNAFTRISGFAQGAGAGFRDTDIPGGPSIFGGFGFLVDAHGNDTYFGPAFCQGAGYGFASGAILDCEGNDLYDVRCNGQGCGIGFATGILVDQAGNDRYFGNDTVQAGAVDASAGFLLDYKGDDIYRHTGKEAQGYARHRSALAILIDYNGNDRYEGNREVQGQVLPPVEPVGQPAAIFLDHHGRDTYLEAGTESETHRNDTVWNTSYGAAGCDTEEDASLYFVGQRGHSRLQQYDMAPVEGLESNQATSSLGARDPYRRFHALSGLTESSGEKLSLMVRSMNMGHPEYRRIVEEGMLLSLLRSGWAKPHLASIAPLCNSIDPDTRQWCLEMFARGDYTDGLPSVRRLLDDPEPDVRRTAAWLLGRFKDEKSIDGLRYMAEHDAAARCRREAIIALLRIKPERSAVTFRETLRDPDPSVVVRAAEAVGVIRDRHSVGILQLLASTGDIYLRRAAGRALIQIGDKSGFPILIDTLSYRCEDNSETYGKTALIDFLASYAGTHLGFDQEAWKEWWSRSEMALNLDRNIEARSKYLELIKKSDRMTSAALVKQLDALRRAFPGYAGFDPTLVRILSRRAGNVLEKAPSTALLLARLAYLMRPDTEHRIILIKALAATGDVEGALEHVSIALESNPSDETLRRLRNRLLKKEKRR